MVFLSVIAHRFCCLHSRPPQGRGECEGGTFDGFPHSRSVTRPQATDFCAAKVAAPKRKTILTDGVSFCDCPQVSLFVRLAYRKSEKRNEARTRYRHPTNGRAIRRSPAGPLDSTRFAPVEAASSSLPATFQKENTILTDGVSFWSGRRGSNSLPRPWQGGALPDELRPHTAATIAAAYGASGRNRTNDTRIFSPLLYQLSYRGIW